MRAWRRWGGALWGSSSDDAPCAGPVLDVLQGVGLLAPRRAHQVLRGAIGLASPPSEREVAAIRMLGRRFVVEPLPADALVVDVSPAARWLRRAAPAWVGDSPPLFAVDDERAWLALAQRAAGAGGSTRGRAVGALLVSDDGRLLAAAAHRTVGRRADHAELLLAQRWWSVRRAAFPSGARVYVTREPCRMCAAALASLLAPHPVIAVVFGEAETGPSSRGSALAARQRACGGQ